MPEATPCLSSDWLVEEPLFSSKRPSIISEWSLFLKAGVRVSVCMVLNDTLFEELSWVVLTPLFQETVFSSCG